MCRLPWAYCASSSSPLSNFLTAALYITSIISFGYPLLSWIGSMHQCTNSCVHHMLSKQNADQSDTGQYWRAVQDYPHPTNQIATFSLHLALKLVRLELIHALCQTWTILSCNYPKCSTFSLVQNAPAISVVSYWYSCSVGLTKQSHIESLMGIHLHSVCRFQSKICTTYCRVSQWACSKECPQWVFLCLDPAWLWNS